MIKKKPMGGGGEVNWSRHSCVKNTLKMHSKKNPQILPIISSIFLTFLSDNLVYVYTKNANNINISSNCAYNIGQVFDFCAR